MLIYGTLKEEVMQQIYNIKYSICKSNIQAIYWFYIHVFLQLQTLLVCKLLIHTSVIYLKMSNSGYTKAGYWYIDSFGNNLGTCTIFLKETQSPSTISCKLYREKWTTEPKRLNWIINYFFRYLSHLNKTLYTKI